MRISEMEQFCGHETSVGCFEFNALTESPSRRHSIDSWIYESEAQVRPGLEK